MATPPKRVPFYYRMHFLLACLFLTFMMFLKEPISFLNMFHAMDQIPILQANKPNKTIQFGNGLAKVEVGLNIDSFTLFDTKEGKFAIEGDIWFQFNPDIISLDGVSKFQFDNGSIVLKSDPVTKLIGSMMFASYHIKVEFLSPLDHHLFPFNDHRVSLVLKNDFFNSKDLYFEVDFRNLQYREGLKPLGWIPLAFEAKTGYFQTDLKTSDEKKILNYPAVVFTLSMMKPGFRKIFAIIAPCLLLFLLGLIALLIQQHNLQVTVAVGSLSGLIIYRFVIEALIPNVGYFTPADYLYMICLASIFSVLLIVVQDIHHKILMVYKMRLYYTIQVVAVVLFFYLTEVTQ